MSITLYRALALNCDAPLNDKDGAESRNWRAGKPVRVVRSSKGRRISKYAPEEGNRYDGIYKVRPSILLFVLPSHLSMQRKALAGTIVSATCQECRQACFISFWSARGHRSLSTGQRSASAVTWCGGTYSDGTIWNRPPGHPKDWRG